MNKKLIIIGLLFILMSGFASPAYCGDAVKKLGRGVCNLITFPLEFLLQISRVNNTDGPMAGVTYGALKGTGMLIVRAAVGAYEVITFPFPFPKDYAPILTDPEFMFEEKSW